MTYSDKQASCYMSSGSFTVVRDERIFFHTLFSWCLRESSLPLPHKFRFVLANFIHSSGHLIRAEMPDDLVRYNISSDARESVSVRFERPQVSGGLLFVFSPRDRAKPLPFIAHVIRPASELSVLQANC